MRGRAAATAVVAAAIAAAALAPQDAHAHAALTRSDPTAAATLGAPPSAVRLTFSEEPQPSLSSITVTDAKGGAHQVGRANAVPGDPTTLSVPTKDLGRGVYTVTYRVVSAVDGHAGRGAYAFGVGVSPRNAVVAIPSATQSTSKLELLARWTLLAGLVLLLGAAVAGVARFGGTTGTDALLAAAGCATAVLGLLLLAEAQRRTAGSSLTDLLDTRVGHALIWRAVAVAAAAVALIVAWRRPRLRRQALAATAVTAVAAIAVHVAAGHAAAGGWSSAITVTAQTVHFAAAGVWLGGLIALLVGVRGAASGASAASVRRFSAAALVPVIALAATGILRAIDELSAFDELTSTGYGRAILVKLALLAAIVALAARNRRRNVPVAAEDLGPLRRTSRVEIGLAAGALAAAAVLGALAPPAPVQAAPPPGIKETGTDAGGTVRVRLEAKSDEPGPNSFEARVEDPGSGRRVAAGAVSLRFVPLDDPGERPSRLVLRRAADGDFEAEGANLRFEGRWRVTAGVTRAGSTTQVPIDVDVRGPEHFVSVLRPPNQPPKYTMEIRGVGYLQISPDPARPGASRLSVNVFNVFESEIAVQRIVVTTQAADGPVRPVALRRAGRGHFAGPIVLEQGDYAIAVTAHSGRRRLHGEFDLKIPRG